MVKRKRTTRRRRRRKRVQRGRGFDLVGTLNKWNPPELHLPGYQFAGPFTKLNKRLDKNNKPKAWSKPKNRLDNLAYHHDLAYQNIGQSKHPSHRKKKMVWDADQKMIDGINKFKNKTMAERFAKVVLQVKKKAKL